MFRCDFCFKEFNKENSLIGHYGKCLNFKRVKDEILNEEFLREEIEKKGRSANSLAIEMNNNGEYPFIISASKIINACKKYGIKTYSIKESVNLKETRDKFKKTCMERYGAENPLFKGTDGYKKRNKTVFEKYGVENVFQSEEIKEKSKETMIEKYGVPYSIYLPNRKRNIGIRSGIHKKVEKMLDGLQIDYESEKVMDFYGYNKYLNDNYNPRPDIILKDKKIVIEINGNYWHANPDMYKPNDLIYKWGGKKSAKEIWSFDKSRIDQIESFGYKVIVLWEKDIIKMEKESLWKLI